MVISGRERSRKTRTEGKTGKLELALHLEPSENRTWILNKIKGQLGSKKKQVRGSPGSLRALRSYF